MNTTNTTFIVQIRDNIDTNLWRGVVEWTTCTKRKVTGVEKPTPEGVVRFRHLKWTVYLDCAHRFSDFAEAASVAAGLGHTYGAGAIRILSVTVSVVNDSAARPTMDEMVDGVIKYARMNYNVGGWDYVIEAMDRSDVANWIGDAATIDEAIARVGDTVRALRDREDDIRAEAF